MRLIFKKEKITPIESPKIHPVITLVAVPLWEKILSEVAEREYKQAKEDMAELNQMMIRLIEEQEIGLPPEDTKKQTRKKP